MSLFKKKSEEETMPDLSGVDMNSRSPMRWGLIILLIGFGGFILWASFAPLDAGITASGTVKVAGNRKTIAHLEGGTVDAIMAHEGDVVKANQVLVRLNPTRAMAEQGVATAQYVVNKAIEARLIAERDGADAVKNDPELERRFKDDPNYIEAKRAQSRLFEVRRGALKGEIAILRDNQRGAEEQLKGMTQVQANRKLQIGFINRELSGVRDLAKDGYLPKNRMFELERDASQLQAALSSDMVDAGRVRSQISEIKLRIIQRQQDYQKEVQSQLSDVQKEATALADRLQSLDYSVRETQVRSPIDGVVMNVNVHTVGGVIGAGQPIMEVVPENEPFIVEAQVPVESIDKMHVGLPVEITFPAFNHARTPNIPGEVVTLSADRLTDERTHAPYYLAQIAVTKEGMKLLGDNDIRPGMSAAVLIRTGERTMLSYLLKPMLDRVNRSFKEQ
jgi:protease secretion system membrane fusion protein